MKHFTAFFTGLAMSMVAVAGAAPTHTVRPQTPTPTATVGVVEKSGKGPVLLLEINGTINPATADYIREGINAALEREATAVLIQMDTPGGLLQSSREMVKDILGAPVPIIIYVSPSGGGAISAGVFITMAAHVAAMAPGTNIGAAHPVGGQGEDIQGDMRAKVESFAASLSRTIAEQRGRNAEWAEKAVRESVSITETEAVKLNVVDLVASDVSDLLKKVDGREVTIGVRKMKLDTNGRVIERFEMRLRQKLIDVLASANLAYLLLLAGIVGLYVELTNPGVVFPGVAGVICLLLGLASLHMLPFNLTGLLLIAAGVVMLILEVFVPSFGALGIGGIIAFVIGSLLLFDTPDSNLEVNRGLIFGAAGALGFLVLVLGWMLASTRRVVTRLGSEGMIGQRGLVRREAQGAARMKVFVRGEIWDAEADQPLPLDSPVEVIGVDGLKLRVRALS